MDVCCGLLGRVLAKACPNPPALFSALRDVGLAVASGAVADVAAAAVLRCAACRIAHHFRRGDLAPYSEHQLTGFAGDLDRVGRLVGEGKSPGAAVDAPAPPLAVVGPRGGDLPLAAVHELVLAALALRRLDPEVHRRGQRHQWGGGERE